MEKSFHILHRSSARAMGEEEELEEEEEKDERQKMSWTLALMLVPVYMEERLALSGM